MDEVIDAFLRVAIRHNATEKNVKYILQRMLQVSLSLSLRDKVLSQISLLN